MIAPFEFGDPRRNSEERPKVEKVVVSLAIPQIPRWPDPLPMATIKTVQCPMGSSDWKMKKKNPPSERGNANPRRALEQRQRELSEQTSDFSTHQQIVTYQGEVQIT